MVKSEEEVHHGEDQPVIVVSRVNTKEIGNIVSQKIDFD